MRSIEESLVFIQWILSDLQEILGCWAIRKFWIAGWMSRFRTNFHYFWELPIEGRILTSRGCWEGFLPLKGTLPETISGWLEAAKGKMRFWHIVYIYIDDTPCILRKHSPNKNHSSKVCCSNEVFPKGIRATNTSYAVVSTRPERKWTEQMFLSERVKRLSGQRMDGFLFERFSKILSWRFFFENSEKPGRWVKMSRFQTGYFPPNHWKKNPLNHWKKEWKIKGQVMCHLFKVY